MRAIVGTAVTAVVLMAASAASAANLPADTTAVVSGTPNLVALLSTPVVSASASTQSVDHDGRLVTFESSSPGLMDGDDDSVSNIYVKDMATGALTLASVADNGTPSHVSCGSPVISDDGTRVAFVCFGSLDAADPGTFLVSQVYERDIAHGHTYLVSRASGLGAAGDQASGDPTIDADGTHVAFDTTATNLGDSPSTAATPAKEVYRRTIGAGDATVLVSRATGAAGAAAFGALHPSIDNTGNDVAFESAKLDPADNSSRGSVYVRHVDAAQTELVSRASGANGAVGDFGAHNPAIAGDGNSVVFASQSDNLDPLDTIGDDDVFRRSLLSDHTTSVVDIKPDGTKVHGAPLQLNDVSTNDTGTVTAFIYIADNVDPAVPPGVEQVYARVGNAIVLVSRGDGPAGAPAPQAAAQPAVSGDGTHVAFFMRSTVVADYTPHVFGVAERNLAAATTATVSRPPGSAPFVNQGGENDGGSVSADGRFVAFVTDAPALGAPAGVREAVVVRDVATGALMLASRDDGPSGAPFDGFLDDPVISGDGHRVAFQVHDATNQTTEIYVRDLATDQTFLASRADGPDGAPDNSNEAEDPAIDFTGSRVAWDTEATNLADGDTDRVLDVHVRDLDAGRTFLASRADGPAGAKGNGNSFSPSLSSDGRLVAFASTASNLGDGDTDTVEDVHVRAIDDGVTQLVSVNEAGQKGDQASSGPVIDGDGNRILFASQATNFTPAQAQPTAARLYLRDRSAKTLTLVGRGDGADGAPANNVFAFQLSADGSTAAFAASSKTPLAPGDRGDGTAFEAYARRIAANQTILVSRASGPNGAAFPLVPVSSTLEAEPTGITADGGCVVFEAFGPLVSTAVSDFEQVYLRTLTANCGRPAPPDDGGGGTGGGGTGGGGSGGGSGTPDRTPPRITNVKLSRTSFRVGPTRTALRASARPGIGTVLSLTISEPAKLTLSVYRERPGRKAGTKRKPVCRIVAKAPRHGACIALSLDATLHRTLGRKGAVRIAFSGRLGAKRLALGRHRIVLVARDAAGNASRPVTVRFSVVKSL
jgi:Tol biopolymer transport system component